MKVKFGIGVDEAQWKLGAAGQGDFLAQADAAGMMWSWAAGYKFLAFEGTFTSSTVTTATPFMIHTGKTGTDYNYTEVTVDFPTPPFPEATAIIFLIPGIDFPLISGFSGVSTFMLTFTLAFSYTFS